MHSWFFQSEQKASDRRVFFSAVDCTASKLEELEEFSCQQFIDCLLTKNPRERLSVASAQDHSYLTLGYLHQFSEVFAEIKNRPPTYHIRQLYSLPPSQIQWPDDMSSGEGVAGDESWARRQFSTLWAPMPKSYDINGDVSGFESLNVTTNLLKTHGRDDSLNIILGEALPVVDETDRESTSPFISSRLMDF
jgi:serine/threonine protein kinase